MEVEVYCDESSPDVLTSSKPQADNLLIGGLWVPKRLRERLKQDIKGIRANHNVYGEIKWNSASRSKMGFYKEIIDLFTSTSELRFHCVAIERPRDNIKPNGIYEELGFYTFYYHLLNRWISDDNQYNIYCDIKSNRNFNHLAALKKHLANGDSPGTIVNIQSLPSREMSLIQVSDLLLGCASARVNKVLSNGSSRAELARYLETVLCANSSPTVAAENKFNIFNMQLDSHGQWH